MQASKWQKIQVLMNGEEMSALLDHLGNFGIYLTGIVTLVGEGSLSKSQFLEVYKEYIDAIKQGLLPDEKKYHAVFSAVFSLSSELLYAVPLENNKQLIRVARPVIQLQPHSMGYSIYDQKFRPMVFGLESILWGIQFSYPLLFLDNRTKEILHVDEGELFPNTHLFHTIQRWIRHHTIPTPFLAGNLKVNVPMRLGKQCLSSINRHPHLHLKNLKVSIP